jgi:hypothetical protein
MSHVFLSYAREDTPTAASLAQLLEARGFDVWWDREIPYGQTWDDVIGQRLDTAACVIVLWSQASVKSRWVREEADRALSRECLLPVMIDSVELPLGFGRIHAADLTSWRGGADEPAFVDLVASIHRLLNTHPPSVAAEVHRGEDNQSQEQKHATSSSRFHPSRRWLLVGVIAALLVVLVSRYAVTRSNKQTWFLINSIQVEGRLANAPVKVVIWVNGVKHRYPNLGGAEWMEVGLGMSRYRVKVASASAYEVRFEMRVKRERGELRLISQETDVFADVPYDGQYKLHQVKQGTRARPTSAIISYRLFNS